MEEDDDDDEDREALIASLEEALLDIADAKEDAQQKVALFIYLFIYTRGWDVCHWY